MARPKVDKYEHPDGESEGSIMPSGIRSLDQETQQRLIETWFYSFFADPAYETPYNGREGGYLYIHGGPYDAREEIEAEFGYLVDHNIIEAAIELVESDGTDDWAPSSQHPDRIAYDEDAIASLESDERERPISTGMVFRADSSLGPDQRRNSLFDHDQIDARLDRSARTSFGASYDRAVRRTIQTHASDLKVLLANSTPKTATHGGIGHNQPPSDIELDEEHKEELKEAVETISEQLGREQPDVRKVSRAARVIQSIGRWAAQKLNMTLDAFLKAMAATLGTSAAGAIAAVGLYGYDAVIGKAMELYLSVIEWLNAVVLPF